MRKKTKAVVAAKKDKASADESAVAVQKVFRGHAARKATHAKKYVRPLHLLCVNPECAGSLSIVSLFTPNGYVHLLSFRLLFASALIHAL